MVEATVNQNEQFYAYLRQHVTQLNATDAESLNQALFHTQRLAGVGTLTASVAHELTNPLSIITATCSNLVHEINKTDISPERLLYYIQMIEQSAWRSARIVEVLRHYTQHNSPQTAVTDLNTIIEDSLTLVRQQFLKEFNVTIATEFAPDVKSIVCDHNRITQVLINLLTNACHAMQPGGGLIQIKAWAIQSMAELAGENGKNNGAGKVAFSVRDQGHGIAPDIMDKIFTPFFTTKPGGMGMGLGLFIARGIVEQHNGRIWAENNPGGGATFTVVLPQRS